MPRGLNNQLTVVLIDDNEAHLDLIGKAVEAGAEGTCDISVRPYADANEALADLPAAGRVVILCDYLLGGASGLDWLPDFVRANVGPVIIITSSGDQHIAAEAFRHGAADYLDKDTAMEDPFRLQRAISEALRRFRLEETNRDLARKLKLANNELHRKNTVLAELTDTAHQFVDDVAHEFRTPLAVIKEFASIIADGIGGEVTAKQSNYLQFITDASRDLAHLIDDFLDSGKLRAGTLRVDRREHHVADLVSGAWPLLESRAKARGVVIERRIDDDLPTIFADADKMRRTLINLVVNAIKFSSKDGVVTVAASRTDNDGVTVHVIDRGPGLPADEVQQLFGRFKQSSIGIHASSTGFGLGLNIVKDLVAINLGTVSVESEVGTGSTFSFTLPAYRTESILKTFIQGVTDRNSGAMLSMLRVSAIDDVSLNDIQSFVASVCYATDIQIVEADAIYLIGETIEPDCWRSRLLEQDEQDRDSDARSRRASLRVDHLGTWPLPDAERAILELVKPSTGALCCA